MCAMVERVENRFLWTNAQHAVAVHVNQRWQHALDGGAQLSSCRQVTVARGHGADATLEERERRAHARRLRSSSRCARCAVDESSDDCLSDLTEATGEHGARGSAGAKL